MLNVNSDEVDHLRLILKVRPNPTHHMESLEDNLI